MMSFMMKKKRYKFMVNFELEELSSVPFVSGILFAKLRLVDGGHFTELSGREEVCANCVKWRSKFQFPCKMTATANTGVLEQCICRVSVRRELKGGRTFQKLGFADINLAEFAGSGTQVRNFLLEGYNSKHRQDNSTLKITLDLSLVSGDPVFKVPSTQTYQLPGEIIEEERSQRVVDDSSEGSVVSNSSGFGSLPRKEKTTVISQDPSEGEASKDKEFELGHSRSASYTSQHSRGSGYGSITHSRQSSLGNEVLSAHQYQHARTPSTGSTAWSDSLKLDRRRKLEDPKEKRVDLTRVDAEDLVDELLRSTDLGLDDTEETSGLQLFIDKDGRTGLR
ncbi:hypothetical protein ScPMuIL_009969 [Solemya velum]